MERDKSNVKSIQLQVTNEEYADLAQRAKASGLTVPLYVKSQIFQDSEFDKYFKMAKAKLDEQGVYKPFSLKSLMGDDWKNISSDGQRLSLGRAFKKYIDSERSQEVEDLKKDTANTQMYMKILPNEN